MDKNPLVALMGESGWQTFLEQWLEAPEGTPFNFQPVHVVGQELSDDNLGVALFLKETIAIVTYSEALAFSTFLKGRYEAVTEQVHKQSIGYLMQYFTRSLMAFQSVDDPVEGGKMTALYGYDSMLILFEEAARICMATPSGASSNMFIEISPMLVTPAGAEEGMPGVMVALNDIKVGLHLKDARTLIQRMREQVAAGEWVPDFQAPIVAGLEEAVKQSSEMFRVQ